MGLEGGSSGVVGEVAVVETADEAEREVVGGREERGGVEGFVLKEGVELRQQRHAELGMDGAGGVGVADAGADGVWDFVELGGERGRDEGGVVYEDADYGGEFVGEEGGEIGAGGDVGHAVVGGGWWAGAGVGGEVVGWAVGVVCG